MKLTLAVPAGISIGVTVTILAYALWRPTLVRALNDEPETPHGWTPRTRTWKNGIEQ